MAPTLPKDSVSMDATVFSKIVKFGSNIYRFGGCLGGAKRGVATDRVYWGEVNLGNPTVRWREQDPSPRRLTAHSAVVAGPDHVLVLGGMSACLGDSAAYRNNLWQWNRTDGGWLELTPIPEACGLAFHTANIDENLMVVFGGHRGTCGTTPRVSRNLWWFNVQTSTWTKRLGEKVLFWQQQLVSDMCLKDLDAVFVDGLFGRRAAKEDNRR